MSTNLIIKFIIQKNWTPRRIKINYIKNEMILNKNLCILKLKKMDNTYIYISKY